MNYKELLETIGSMAGNLGIPKSPGLRTVPTPPAVHPFGPGYSMHPELSRSGLGYVIRSIVVSPLFYVPVTAAVSTVMFIDAHNYLVQDLPENEHSSYWRSISQALVGGVGIGTAGSQLVS